MNDIKTIDDIPSTLLAYLAGCWLSAVQSRPRHRIACADSSDCHAFAAAAVYTLNARGADIVSATLAAEVDHVGCLIREEGGETTAVYPPTDAVIADVLMVAEHMLWTPSPEPSFMTRASLISVRRPLTNPG